MNIVSSRYSLVLLFFFLVSLAQLRAQDIIINELMSVNGSTIRDADGGYEDWVELYNSGNQPVNLVGYGLSDDADDPFSWTFPQVIIAPGEHLIVWASGKDLKPVNGWLNGLRREVYRGINGSTITSLTSHASFPDNPTEVYHHTTPFDAPVNVGDNYGQRMHGYLLAPQTGFYTFWIACDNNGKISLSTDQNPASLVQIARVNGYTDHMAWDKYDSQKSEQIFLQQDQYYYVEALMKEGTGGDNLSVRWQLPDGALEEPIPVSRMFIHGNELHANFALSSNGERLLLTRPDGQLADQVDFDLLPADVSWGRQTDGADSWLYFSTPTPGKSNAGNGGNDILASPSFSSPGGIYSSGFELILSHSDPAVDIYYTLDGSVPDPGNVDGKTFQYKNQYQKTSTDEDGDLLERGYKSHEYKTPISVIDQTATDNPQWEINTTFETSALVPREDPLKGTVVRARAFKEGSIPSEMVSNTYIIRQDAYAVPVVSLVMPEESFFGYEKGIHVPGKTFDEWREQYPNNTASGRSTANYHNRGIEWERETNIEFFDTLGNTVFNHRAGARIHGVWSRSHPQKSIRLYARSSYGTAEFKHQLFPDKPTDTFKRFVLRSSGNDHNHTFFRDAFIHRLVRNRPIDIQHWQPVVVFLNAEYWGLLNIRDRTDNYYLHYKYGVDHENLDILRNDALVSEGDYRHYYDMINYIRANDITDSVHYAHVNTLMDTDNFAEYYAIEIYSNNRDWLSNNVDFWRVRTDKYEPDAPYGHDGRWRWILFDTDHGFWPWENGPWENTLEWATQEDWSTELFTSLLKNEQFRHKMINRFADLMNTALHPDTVHALIEDMKQVYNPVMPDHIDRWYRIWSMGNWDTNIGRLRDYASQRPEYMTAHLEDHFELTGHYDLTVNVASGNGTIRINTIKLDNPHNWQGMYFNGVPVEIEAMAGQGYKFSRWEGFINSTEALVSITADSDFSLQAHFEPGIDPVLITYWMFDDKLPNDTPLQTINDTYHMLHPASIQFQSALDGYPFDSSHPSWRKASMERRNRPTDINYRPKGNNQIPYAESNMRGIQIKQPFSSETNTNTLIFILPTSGFEDVIFSFAAQNENGAARLVVDYSVSAGQNNWITSGLENHTFELSDFYKLFVVDFSAVDAADNNPDFTIRITFDGANLSANEGGRINFNNFSLDGIPLDNINQSPKLIAAVPLINVIESGDPVLINLNEVFQDPDGDELTFSVRSSASGIVQAQVLDHVLEVTPLQRGDARITISAIDQTNPALEHAFRVMVYPAAIALLDEDFNFTRWDANAAEMTFPANMLFLQSAKDDPGLNDTLAFPYFILHSDYHDDDSLSVGFPYNNTRRTRINGLDENGISFINTGRGRDLGGALVAVNTLGLDEAYLAWTAATVQPNKRSYGIKLLYRLGTEGAFTEIDSGNPHTHYTAAADGDIQSFPALKIPQALLNQEYVQFLWKYYHIAGDSGPRAELRLDDISISRDSSGTDTPDYLAEVNVYPNPVRDVVHVESEVNIFAIDVLDISGALRMKFEHQGNRYSIPLAPYPAGIYFLRVFTPYKVHVFKLQVLN